MIAAGMIFVALLTLLAVSERRFQVSDTDPAIGGFLLYLLFSLTRTDRGFILILKEGANCLCFFLKEKGDTYPC